MTTNVPKGAGRGTASAKRKKHAQRTSLPPRPGTIEAAQALVAEFLGGTIIATPASAKSNLKAHAFMDDAIAAGWSASEDWPGEDRWVVEVTRGQEKIVIEWQDGVFVDSCEYSHAGRTPIKLRNASAAKKRLTVPPAVAAEEAQKVSAHKVAQAPRAVRSPGTVRGALPFSEASLDADVIEVLGGRRITWLNTISGTEEEDQVIVPVRDGKGRLANQPKITEGKRGRTLTFVGAGGWHDVLLASICRVR